MFLNGVFGEPVADAAIYQDAVILKLATRYGWLPQEVARMSLEWVFKTLEYADAVDAARAVLNNK